MTADQKRILIVDDDTDFAEAVSFFLETHHYRVMKARDGAQALRMAKRERPDLILMDIMMGERTEGLFTVQEIRRTPELAGVPIFVLSALYSSVPDFGVAPEAAWMGHDEFIPKPVDLTGLLDKVRARIGAASPEAET